MWPGSHPLTQVSEERHVSEWGPDAFRGAGQTAGFSKGGGQSHSRIRPNCPGDSPTSGSKMATEEGRVGGSTWPSLSPDSRSSVSKQLHRHLCACAYVLKKRNTPSAKKKIKKSFFLRIEDVVICNDYGKYHALYDFWFLDVLSNIWSKNEPWTLQEQYFFEWPLKYMWKWITCGETACYRDRGYSAHPAVQSDGSEWVGRQPLVTDASAEACARPNQKDCRCIQLQAQSSLWGNFIFPISYSSWILLFKSKKVSNPDLYFKTPLHICVRVTRFRMHGNYVCDHPCGHRVFQSGRNGAFWRTYFDKSWSAISWVLQLQYSGNYSYRTLQDLECFHSRKLIKETIKN